MHALRLVDKIPAVHTRCGEIVSVGATQWVAPTTTVTYRSLLGFEVAPGEITRVADVPEAVDFGRICTDGDIQIGEIDPVDRQAGHVPVVDERAQVAGLPAEGACAIKGEGRRDGGRDRTAGSGYRGRCACGC